MAVRDFSVLTGYARWLMVPLRRAVIFVLVTLTFAASTTNALSPTAGVGASGSIVPQDTTRVTTVIPGAQYAAGGLYRFLWGDHYRDAWTTEVSVPVLDLGQFADGLTPLSAGGGFQTKSLWFAGANGRPYAFRSIHKSASRMVPEVLRGTFVEELARDQMCLQHPFGPLVVERLEHAAGVLHTDPRAYVLPDDQALGEFREDFAGELGILAERPTTSEGEVATYSGVDEIIDAFEMVERTHVDPRVQVHSPAYLRARLLDVLTGDFDRHADQWRWADFGADSTPGWRPIPRDRDLAFARLDGLIIGLTRRRIPMLSSFGESYGDLSRLHYQARFLDRLFLTELERPVWDSVAANLASSLTDRVIDDAVNGFPPEIEAVDGEFFRGTLKARRDALPHAAIELYELMSREPYVHATNVAEIAEITELHDGMVEVAIRAAVAGSEPHFRRVFHRAETREVRLYLHGGADRAIIEGGDRLPVRVRIIGGEGDDEFHFLTRTSNVSLYDQAGSNAVTGAATASIKTRAYDIPPIVPEPGTPAPARHWGGLGYPTLLLGYGPDFGFTVRFDYTWFDYGFRKNPYASRVDLSAKLATALKGALGLEAAFHMENSPWFVRADLLATSLQVLHFFGIGNDIERSPERPRDFYDVDQRVLRGGAAIRYKLGRQSSVGLGLFAQYASTDEDSTTLLGQIPDLYGAGSFGSAGAEFLLNVGTPRPSAMELVEPRVRGSLDLSAAYHPPIFDVVTGYGLADALGILAVPLGFRLSEIAFRAGGRKVWGEVPVSDLAFIGGDETLRGLPLQRFAGDASLYGGAELRLDLFNYRLIIPSTFGVLGMVDAGRVWVDGQTPGGWHYGYGGGVWIALRGTRSILSAVYAESDEDQGFYLNVGFSY